jgi:hypothetical protein
VKAVLAAIAITLVYFVLHLGNARVDTAVLSGTATDAPGLGILYIAAYFAFVLVVPILLLAAGVLKLLRSWRQHPPS